MEALSYRPAWRVGQVYLTQMNLGSGPGPLREQYPRAILGFFRSPVPILLMGPKSSEYLSQVLVKMGVAGQS
jgi:hypothetical protein